MNNPLEILALDRHLIKAVELTLFRPATIDLVLTKMARGDEQDLDDIRFLFHREPLSKEALRAAFSRARVPEVPEIRELFEKAQPKVLEFADSISRAR